MTRRCLALCFAGLALGAFEPLDKPTGRITAGAYEDRFSDATGRWKGQFLTAEWFRDDHGPWSASIARSQRPEGSGTTFMIAKEHGFSDTTWISGGVSAGSGADFLPTFRLDLDGNLGLQGPWGLGLGAAWSRFSDGISTTLLQAGPSWTGEVWSASLRAQALSYGSGGGSDAGAIADLRWGASSLRRWHSVKLAWGRGIIDSLQPGGGFTAAAGGTSTGTGSGRGRGKGSSGPGLEGASSTAAPLELLASTAAHLPLTRHFALKAEAGWGRREGQFVVFSGSLQAVFTF